MHSIFVADTMTIGARTIPPCRYTIPVRPIMTIGSNMTGGLVPGGLVPVPPLMPITLVAGSTLSITPVTGRSMPICSMAFRFMAVHPLVFHPLAIYPVAFCRTILSIR